MSINVLQILTDLGLSESETKVYVASLKIGPTSIQEIAKQSRLSRTATYDAVAKLLDRGLMTKFQRGKKLFFVSEDPDRVIAFFRQKVRKMREKLEILETNVPELKMLMGGDRPTVRFYDGKEALHALFEDVAKLAPSHVDEVSNMDDVYEHLDIEYLHAARKVLDVDRIHLRILHRGELRNPRKGVEFCKLLPEFENFHGDIWIYGNRVAFVQFFGKLLTVIIESDSFSGTVRVLFEVAWKASSDYNKKPDHA